MALDVKVKIELSKIAGGVGFGIPLLLEAKATKAVAYTECYNLNDVVTAGFAEETEMYKAANLLFMQNNRPEKIAVCASVDEALAAVQSLVDKNWRQLYIVDGSENTENGGLAAYIETTGNKLMFLNDTATKFGSIIAPITNVNPDRTICITSSTPHAAAALIGETAGRPAGSFTYKFKTLKGVTPDALTDAELETIHAANAIAYVTKAGDDVTTEGTSLSGKYIDITDSIDYVIQNIEYRVQKTFNNNDRVTYDDRGIALLEAAVTSALQDAGNNGIIAANADGSYDYSVTFAPRSATTEADRASRTYKYGSFRFALAGAIHSCEVYGEITY